MFSKTLGVALCCFFHIILTPLNETVCKSLYSLNFSVLLVEYFSGRKFQGKKLIFSPNLLAAFSYSTLFLYPQTTPCIPPKTEGVKFFDVVKF